MSYPQATNSLLATAMSFAIAKSASLKRSFLLSKNLTSSSSLGAVRTKATLPDLDYDFGALEPFISGKINELHYTKHHQNYVNGFNTATEQLAEAKAANDTLKQIELTKAIKFNGGGHINHSLFWKNLAPVSAGGGEPPSGALAEAIQSQYGSLDKLVALTNTKLAGIQGSGWAWIVKNKENSSLEVITLPNQDPVPSAYIPVVGIDAWEHAYYLQYNNVKADYFKAIWNVINWKEAEKRFSA